MAGIAPRRRCSCVDQLVIYHLHRTIPDVVHPLHPQHLILRFELFGDTLMCRHLFYQLKEHGFRLFVQVGKILQDKRI